VLGVGCRNNPEFGVAKKHYHMNKKNEVILVAIFFFNFFLGNVVIAKNSPSPLQSATPLENKTTIVGSESDGLITELNEDGAIKKMKVYYASGWQDVEFRSDKFRGPGFGSQITMKQKSQDESVYCGEMQGIIYQIIYSVINKGLRLNVTIQNNSGQDFIPKQLPLYLGINTYMDKFPQWNQLYFPTFLRCEPTHFWGYMMTPLGKILGISCKDPVGSYTVEYQKSLYSHYIYTVTLDLMHKPPLPDHNPIYKPLTVGEKRSWTIDFMAIEGLNQIKSTLSRYAEAPVADMYSYTLEPQQPAEINIHSPYPVSLTITTPSDKRFEVKVNKQIGTSVYGAKFTETGEYGYYEIRTCSENGKVAMGSFYVRPKWSWYINSCRQEALRLTPRADLKGGADGYSCETYYGLLGFWLAAKHFPDPAMDVKGSQILEKILARLFREKDGMYFSINKERIQNGSFMISVLVSRYLATKDIESLEMANKFAEYILSRQHKDGYYGGYGMHPYTSVLYVAKSIVELMEAEKELAPKDPKWQERYERHYKSVKLAIDDLVRRKLDVKTEGGSTFEDGSVSCSAAQIAMFGLMQTDKTERKKYTDASTYFLDAHACLTRLLAPDTRSNGSTIRWWEAWNDNKVDGQMTTSPHGWSGWRLYAVYYLYLLTGKEELLQGVMNALGSCSQLMEWPTGRLRQAYVVDPYIEAFKHVPDPNEPFGRRVPHIYGEEYLETIGEWYGQTTAGKNYMDRVEWGWTGDLIPFEIFKAMEEFALTAAYVIEREDGTIKTYNCECERVNNRLIISPSEQVVNRVHFNLKSEFQCKVIFTGGIEVHSPIKGMKWLKETNR